MNRIALFGLMALGFASCQKISGDNHYYLIGECSEIKPFIENELVKVDEGKGIHYVHVDTTNCELEIRYEAEKADLSWVYEVLDSLGYLRNMKPDSLGFDSIQKETESQLASEMQGGELKEVISTDSTESITE